MMHKFRIGDRVGWHIEFGEASGTIIKVQLDEIKASLLRLDEKMERNRQMFLSDSRR